MLSVMSACSQGGSHVTITHDTWDVTVQPPASLDMGPHWTTDPLPTSADIWWLLKYIWSAQAVLRILLECFRVQRFIKDFFPFGTMLKICFLSEGMDNRKHLKGAEIFLNQTLKFNSYFIKHLNHISLLFIHFKPFQS